MDHISQNIKYLRSKKNLTQDELAEKLKLNRHNIVSYEKQKAVPPIDVIISIAKYFELSLDAFVTQDLEKRPAIGLKPAVSATSPVNEPESKYQNSQDMDKMKSRLEKLESEIKLLLQIIESQKETIESQKGVNYILKEVVELKREIKEGKKSS